VGRVYEEHMKYEMEDRWTFEVVVEKEEVVVSSH
jgi:hypothetical protein